MSNDDKLENKTEELKGAAKERLGGATGDEKKQAKGKAERSKADLKQAGEKVKDAFD
ncbi:CsbD family protein [Nocardioides sp. DS6]|uniref:CsbD family protein n=1 Tax=Nocardioides eburneus TaxID=3231482 RepID=A0ABV3T359_9ACTN